MRLLGAGLLWTSLICVGAVYSIKLSKHIVLLERTRLMIEEIKIQLQFYNMPVSEILNYITSKEYLQHLTFLSDCNKLIKEGVDFPDAWKNSLKNTTLTYKSKEKDRLLHLGLNLGISDTENQVNILTMHSLYFDEFITQAKLKKQKYGNLSMSLGVLSGCMIFILII